MDKANQTHTTALQIFEPDPDAVYTIEITAHLADVPRRQIAVYCKNGLISPLGDSDSDGFFFNADGIRTLRQIDYLRNVAGMNVSSIRLVMDLIHTVESLRDEVRDLRTR